MCRPVATLRAAYPRWNPRLTTCRSRPPPARQRARRARAVRAPTSHEARRTHLPARTALHASLCACMHASLSANSIALCTQHPPPGAAGACASTAGSGSVLAAQSSSERSQSICRTSTSEDAGAGRRAAAPRAHACAAHSSSEMRRVGSTCGPRARGGQAGGRGVWAPAVRSARAAAWWASAP